MVTVMHKIHRSQPSCDRFLSNEYEIVQSVKVPILAGGCGNASSASTSSSGGPSSGYNHRDTRIEEGKLFYEKRWFRRGQSVQVKSFVGLLKPTNLSLYL